MPPTRKRTKEAQDAPKRNTKQKLRGRRGSLEAMPGIPLDIIIEILDHLHPRDLLSLARTSKPFRALLMNKRNAFIWKAARTALPGGLPDPHPFLSEPALAHLMFTLQCHNCGRGLVHKVIWLWLRRYCCKCLPNMTWATRYVKERLEGMGLGRIQGSDFRVIANFVSPNHEDEDAWSGEYNHFHAPQVIAFERQWDNAGNNLEIKFAAQLKKWAKEDRERQEQENRQVREERFEDVLRRLKEAGWGPELEFYGFRIRWDRDGPARELHTRRIAPKLTDKTWPKVHDSLEGFMTELRRQRLSKAQQDALDAIDSAITTHCTGPIPHTGNSCFFKHGGPTALDILWMPEVAALFSDTGNASDVVAGLEAVVPRIPQLVVQWEENLKSKLREMVSDLCPGVSDTIDPLDLAIAVFNCAKCETWRSSRVMAIKPANLRYADVLTHSCFRRYNDWNTSQWPLPITKEYQRSVVDVECRGARLARCPLLPERIVTGGAQRAHAVLLQANCDPHVTYAEMQTWDRKGGLLMPPKAEI
ncbi:uncharacterized protein TRAVEDRAFT_71765 [Trametes versicolor FP-101664 SS1]|uniref:uncharacterized protein n=1 Tax=Trametes versicolor (strain FP-101664) TaxID=717944 RepID=UPI0004623D77|nr:uncharacterized protein TRAVEDRAFT_71765 [Trametes versicolor FP-101664 SS1]EIW59840.1 hypothetical protein TRAVEDRAFT_71765 [Trametes versicolor FP-101664 SS1]